MEKPILFNTKMVQAILDGRKTQTRRLPSSRIRDKWCDWDEYQCAVAPPGSILATEKGFYENYPPYEQGDILWVRETWNYGYVESSDREYENDVWFEPSDRKTEGSYMRALNRFWYRADKDDEKDMSELHGFWRPSIHMPREAARIFLRVEFVRIGRLKDFFDASCAYSEGIAINHLHSAQEAVDAFGRLWDSTIKPADLIRYGWNANPLVWVIGFERVDDKRAGLWADRDTAQYADGGALAPAT